MKIAILGTARSGTTAIYSLLQHIFEERYPGALDYVYEPFLWDRGLFNGPYDQLAGRFQTMDSLSFEAISCHLRVPLLVTDPSPFLTDEFLQQFFSPAAAKPHMLLKFIRANGRFRLLQALSPDTRFIFIIRNPADTVNSVLRLFSFFGGEFHRDDFPRFREQVKQVYGEEIPADNYKLPVQKELLYWNYMNRFALESFAACDRPPLILCHEEKALDAEAFVRRICRYVDMPFRDIYVAAANRPVGHLTQRTDISSVEFDLFSRGLDQYADMLREQRISMPVDKKKILDKFQVQVEMPAYERFGYGLTTVHLSTLYRDALSGKERIIIEREAEIKKKNAQLAQKNAQLAQKDAWLTQKDARLAQNETQLAQKNEQLRKLENRWQQQLRISHELKRHIQALYQTRSWKIGHAIVRVGRFFLGKGAAEKKKQ